jgi:hypothetical protein
MSLRPTTIGFSLIVGGIITFSSTPARSASLFSFSTNFSYPGTGTTNSCNSQTQCDVALNSVSVGNQSFDVSELLKVTDAALIRNYRSLAGYESTGGISLERGDNATGTALETLSVERDSTLRQQFNTSGAELGIIETLGNHQQSIFNLNNIIDTEDDNIEGTPDQESVFTLDLLFNGGAAFDSVMLWERGMNSSITLQPIYEVSNNQATTFGEAITVGADEWDDAGYQLDTTEIDLAQTVGSKGIHFESNLQGLRVLSRQQFDGADFKIVGVKRSIPEPSALFGLGVVGGLMALSSRRSLNKKKCNLS